GTPPPPAEPAPHPAPAGPAAPRATAPEDHPGTPRRRTALLAVSGAVLAAAAVAGFASGLFSYEPPARDGAAPESVREAVPQARTTPPNPVATAAPTTAPSAPVTRSPSPAPTASPTPSATPTASPASATPSPTAPAAGPAPSPARTTDSPAPADRDEPAPVLGRGDFGPEVTELQLRLRQLYLYNDDPDGRYTRQVEYAVRNYQWARGVRGDELGVYGPETREKLESETSRP
ncbi:peptidoglycan-binding domain-containing protein, partial [Streptomyces cinereospinus]